MVRLLPHVCSYVSVAGISITPFQAKAQTFAISDVKGRDSNTVLCVQVFFVSVSSRCFSVSDVLIPFLPSRCKVHDSLTPWQFNLSLKCVRPAATKARKP